MHTKKSKHKKKSKKHSKKEYKDHGEQEDRHKSKKRSKDKEISKLDQQVHDDKRNQHEIDETDKKQHYHHHYHHYHHHHHHRSKSRSRSKTRDYEHDKKRRTSSTKSPSRKKSKKHDKIDKIDKIDKTKLLEIAKSNLIKSKIDAQLAEQINIKNEKQQETTSTIVKSGKTINELVEYCRKLTNENDNDDDEIGCNSHDNNEPTTKIYHPFQIKEATNEYLKFDRLNEQKEMQIQSTNVNLNNLSSQFPVSSGTQHRHKENKQINQQFQQSTIVTQQTESTIQQHQQQSSINTIMTISNSIIIQNEANKFVSNIPPKEQLDISSLITQRLGAIKRINKNPNDFEAYQLLEDANEKIETWSNSKQVPGQFTGSTDAKLLAPHELEGSFIAWTRKDLLTKATPITGGIGKKLLEKMGWREGEGLGKKKEGVVNPLTIDIKTDRKGLITLEELPTSAIFLPDGKHPVSALLEFCKARKWPQPVFDVVSESGPPHLRTFIMKVTVNNVAYQPSVSSLSKKIAKANAALLCLKELGIV